jgi:hypothetical protein
VPLLEPLLDPVDGENQKLFEGDIAGVDLELADASNIAVNKKNLC